MFLIDPGAPKSSSYFSHGTRPVQNDHHSFTFFFQSRSPSDTIMMTRFALFLPKNQRRRWKRGDQFAPHAHDIIQSLDHHHQEKKILLIQRESNRL